MKQHSNEFKENIALLGKQQEIEIIFGDTTLTSEDINSITASYEGNLLKSIMKQLEIDSNVNIPLGTEISLKYGLYVNNGYEFIDFGKYIVYSIEKQEDTNSYLINCYDKMLYSMKDYERLEILYPITIRDYIKKICDKIGLSFKNINESFVNYNKTITSDLYVGLGYTYRDILDELAQVTASVICINNNDELEIRYINETNDTINEEYLKDVNVNFGEKYGPVNSIVLSRAGESDNIYLQDEENIEQNGLTEIKIIDNQIMNFNNRDEFLPEILNKLKNIEYYINDFTSTGIIYYDLLDSYNVKIGENTYKCLMLNDEINITQGLEELIHTEIPETSETDYTKADKTDRRINQTYIIVDKQNQKIESVVSQVGEQNSKISQITQTVDELNSKIGEVADVTITGESYNAEVYLEGINASEPILIKIRPYLQSISALYPSKSLFPGKGVYPRGKPKLIFFDKDNNNMWTYTLPDDLNYIDENTYDEFLLDYENQICSVTKRVGIDENGALYKLDIPYSTQYDYPTIALEDGNYSIYLDAYNNGYLFVKLMSANIYTSQFATKVELNSEIKQTKSEIDLSVSEKLTGYPTTTEMNSAINIASNEINLKVEKKVDEKEFTGANIILNINDDISGATIEADKVSLKRKRNKFNIR